MTEPRTPQPQYVLDREQLEKYMLSRAEEFQHRNEWDSSFECLYLMTVINRGWYWDTTGRHHVQICSNAPTPAAPDESVTIRIGLRGFEECGMDSKPEQCDKCSELPNCVLDCFYDALTKFRQQHQRGSGP